MESGFVLVSTGRRSLRQMDTSLSILARTTVSTNALASSRRILTRATGPFPISPIILDTDESIPVRRCVQKWYRESKTRHETGLQVSLFIRALQAFQRLPPENQLSWYRIAAIHGEPCNVPWNTGKPIIPHDDPNKVDRIKAGDGGFYCQHNKDLFPTWHRGYLMLFEVCVIHFPAGIYILIQYVATSQRSNARRGCDSYKGNKAMDVGRKTLALAILGLGFRSNPA